MTGDRLDDPDYPAYTTGQAAEVLGVRQAFLRAPYLRDVMIAAGADLKIYIATRPIDFRCGHDGLAAKVQEMLRLDPFSGAAFVFRSKRADRIKILVWDRTGLVLVHKRLEGCKFVWPTIADGVMRISPAMFAALFEGLDWRLVRPEEARRPQAAG